MLLSKFTGILHIIDFIIFIIADNHALCLQKPAKKWTADAIIFRLNKSARRISLPEDTQEIYVAQKRSSYYN